MARWREQYAAAGEFAVPGFADLNVPPVKQLYRPLTILRGREAPRKKRKGGRRADVLCYAKTFRRECGAAAEAPGGAAPGAAPKASARRGTGFGSRGAI